jgi:putative ABC transport system substrate-binding protein
MRRREFIDLICGAAIAWPLAGRAQSLDRPRRIGVLILSKVNADLRIETIQHGLENLGWTDGRNVHIEYRRAEGDAAKVSAFAKELVEQQPDVLLVQGSVAVQAVLRETSNIPIVFVHVVDPVGQGFVVSAARPGGNVTGFSNYEHSMGGKWLALLKEMTPDLTRVALVANPGTTPYAALFRSVEAFASRLGIELLSAPVHNITELENAFSARSGEPGSALLVLPDVFTSSHSELVVELAARYRVPAMYCYSFFARSGGLISYAVDPEEPFGQAPAYVNRILRGERPGDLPVQGPTKFELVINLKTAKVLGLKVPNTLLVAADEVIE